MAPPATGPTAAPAPTLEESRPSAAPRSPGGSALATAAKPRAGMAEAPMACTMRPATSTGRVGASAQTSEPAASTTSPTENTQPQAVQIGDAPVERDAHREDQQVPRDHPPRLAPAGPEVVLDVRHDDVRERLVEHGDRGSRRPRPPAETGCLHLSLRSSRALSQSADANYLQISVRVCQISSSPKYVVSQISINRLRIRCPGCFLPGSATSEMSAALEYHRR